MTYMSKTAAQHAREDARNSAGKFYKNPCSCCGKGAPLVDYFSDDRTNSEAAVGGFGLVLCGRCAPKVAQASDEEFAQMAQFRAALLTW
jgi:hypothetical protein